MGVSLPVAIKLNPTYALTQATVVFTRATSAQRDRATALYVRFRSHETFASQMASGRAMVSTLYLVLPERWSLLT